MLVDWNGGNRRITGVRTARAIVQRALAAYRTSTYFNRDAKTLVHRGLRPPSRLGFGAATSVNSGRWLSDSRSQLKLYEPVLTLSFAVTTPRL